MPVKRTIALAALTVWFVVPRLWAHDVYRFVGTVTKVEIRKDSDRLESVLELKTGAGEVKLEFKEETPVMAGRDGKRN